MQVALHDSDSTGYPNLALMKLSSFHKSLGDEVSWFLALERYDKIYSSKVFSFTPEDHYLPSGVVKGGTGYSIPASGVPVTLKEKVEHVCPDYNLYNIPYSLGFLTRGCPRKCPWCIVPSKEGDIKPHAELEEFLRHNKAVLMDNNILAHTYGIQQIEKIARLGIRVDFNQGLDARLIDDSIAKLLSKVKWLNPIRLACDDQNQIKAVAKAVELLRWHNAVPRRYFCYVLVRDIDDAIERVRFLKGIHVDPFAQAYIGPQGNEITDEQRHFCRWVNHKAEFKSRTWEDYRNSHMVERHCGA